MRTGRESYGRGGERRKRERSGKREGERKEGVLILVNVG